MAGEGSTCPRTKTRVGSDQPSISSACPDLPGISSLTHNHHFVACPENKKMHPYQGDHGSSYTPRAGQRKVLEETPRHSRSLPFIDNRSEAAILPARTKQHHFPRAPLDLVSLRRMAAVLTPIPSAAPAAHLFALTQPKSLYILANNPRRPAAGLLLHTASKAISGTAHDGRSIFAEAPALLHGCHRKQASHRDLEDV